MDLIKLTKVVVDEDRYRRDFKSRMTELDEYERRFIELEENVQREDLSWQEKCIAKYHKKR